MRCSLVLGIHRRYEYMYVGRGACRELFFFFFYIFLNELQSSEKQYSYRKYIDDFTVLYNRSEMISRCYRFCSNVTGGTTGGG